MDIFIEHDIKTPEQADAYIQALFNNGMLYHFDDPVEECLSSHCLSSDQLETIDYNVSQFYDIPDYDPFVYAVSLVEKDIL